MCSCAAVSATTESDCLLLQSLKCQLAAAPALVVIVV